MKLKLTSTLIVLFSLAASAKQPIPGFQGKRLSFGAQIGIGHAAIFLRPGAMPSLVPSFHVDYTLNRFLVLNAAYSFMYYTYKSSMLFQGISSSSEIYKKYPATMMMHQANVNLKIYMRNKGYIAPVGRYYSVGAFYNHTNQSMVSKLNFKEEFSNDLGRYKATTHNFGVTVGLGRTIVLGRRVLLDYGGNINFMPVFKISGENIVEEEVRQNMLLRNLWQVYVNIGLLAF